MKKLLILSMTLILFGCGDPASQEIKETSTDKTDNKVEQTQPVETPKEEVKIVEPKEEPKEEVKKNEGSKIDTSVFVYAEKVDVTDARDISQHIDLVVRMNEGPTPGLATQHVFSQTYDFIQQEDIKGAKTVTIGVMQKDIRIAQITVNVEKFKPEDDKPMTGVVLKASKIDKMSDEVREFGKVMELW